jgi:hypothetical protein
MLDEVLLASSILIKVMSPVFGLIMQSKVLGRVDHPFGSDKI